MALSRYRNEVTDAFGHQGTERTHAKPLRELVLALLLWLGVAAIGSQATTQWAAHELRYQRSLGPPCLDLRPAGPPLYPPWRAYRWSLTVRRASSRGERLAEQILWGYRGSLGLGLAISALIVHARARDKRNRVGDLHGSARFADRSDVEGAGLLQDDGIVLGQWVDPKTRKTHVLRNRGPEHVLFFATTGSGKGVGCVIPTLLTWKGSAVVLDLKGENYQLTSGYRSTVLGQRVFKLDFGAPEGSTCGLNLLDFIRWGTEQEDADVQRIASARIDPTGALRGAHSDGHHWLTTGIGLLSAAILHAAYRHGLPEPGTSPVSLADVLGELSVASRSLEDLMKSWLQYPHDVAGRREWADSDGAPTTTHPTVSAVARAQLDRPPNERGSVYSTVVAALSVFHDPLLRRNTAFSDFTVDDIMDAERPATIYLVVRPSDMDRLAPVVRLFLELALRRLTEEMHFSPSGEAATHKHELLLLLDEFPALGRVAAIAETLGYLRGWGIRALIVVQSLMQLKEHYGQYESVTGLCGISAAYAPAKVDVETARHLSAMCGQRTVIRRSPNRGTSTGYEEQEIARSLLSPDEISALPGPKRKGREILSPGHMLAFSAGCPAIYAQQYLYFRDPSLARWTQLQPAPPVPTDRVGAPKRSARLESIPRTNDSAAMPSEVVTSAHVQDETPAGTAPYPPPSLHHADKPLAATAITPPRATRSLTDEEFMADHEDPEDSM